MNTEQRFTDMIRHITFNCTGVPQPVAERALFEAMRELAEDSEILKTKVVVSGLQDGIADYDFSDDLPEGYDVCQLRWVMWCGCKLNRVDECDPCPVGFEVIDDTCIVIHPCPNCPSPGDLVVGVTLKPDFTLCEIPKQLLKYEEQLLHGAMANLMRQPKKTWSDQRQAQLHQNLFRAKKTRVRGQVERENTGDGCRARHGFI